MKSPVGAAEGCDPLILIFGVVGPVKSKVKRSQPSAAPSEEAFAVSALGRN
jgi:hypothetical protein